MIQFNHSVKQHTTKSGADWRQRTVHISEFYVCDIQTHPTARPRILAF